MRWTLLRLVQQGAVGWWHPRREEGFTERERKEKGEEYSEEGGGSAHSIRCVSHPLSFPLSRSRSARRARGALESGVERSATNEKRGKSSATFIYIYIYLERDTDRKTDIEHNAEKKKEEDKRKVARGEREGGESTDGLTRRGSK